MDRYLAWSAARDSVRSATKRYLLTALGVGLAYFAAGRLALLLAIPPGYASPIWPAAGLAMAAVLRFGYRLWPAVFVGSVLVNVSIGFDTSSSLAVARSLALPAAIGAGSALQAVVGAFLVRAFVPSPTTFSRPGEIFRTLGLGGPVACVVGATVGAASLAVAAGSGAGIVETWATWWLGDTFGVLVILPVASAWTVDLSGSAGRTRLLVALPLVVALILTVEAFVGVWRSETEQSRAEFGRRAELIARTIDRAVRSDVEIVLSIASLFESTGEIEREHFDAFVRPVLDRHSDLYGLSWNRVVTAATRHDVEAEARRAGFSDFRITERAPSGELVAAGSRHRFVVVYYIEPYEGNEPALGFDLASDPVRENALRIARDTGRVAVTAPISLVQEEGNRPGYLFFAPIYRAGQPRDTVHARRQNIESFVSGVYTAERTVAEAVGILDAHAIEFRIEDTTRLDRPLPLYASAAPGPATSSALDRTSQLQIAGRRWSIHFWPAPDYPTITRWSTSWAVLAGGFLFTSILGAFLLLVVGRGAAAEKANQELRDEIQDRKKAQAALTASERRFRAVFDASTIGVVIADLDGNLLQVNAYVHEMLGYADGSLVGKNISHITPPVQPEVPARRSEPPSGPSTPTVVQSERVYLDAQGANVWAHVRTTSIGSPEGESELVLSVIEDMTARRRLEQERLKSQKLEALGVLAGGIAHDFNNLLMVVGANADMAKGGASGEAVAMLADVGDAVKRARGLTRQLLTFSKGGAPVTKTVDLAALLERWSSFALRGSKTSCALEIAPDLHPVVVDPDQMSQVIGNLIINADQAMAGGGHVRVAATNIELDAETSLEVEPGSYVEIEIGDQGEGIAAETLGRIFDPYFTTKAKGSGLGLATVYSIVRKHRGDVVVDSELGVGTTFRIYLPTANCAAVRRPPQARTEPVAGSGRILVMDDDRMIRRVAKAVLERSGYEVELAVDGAAAVEHYRRAVDDRRGFDAVILDLTVPGGMGGIETLERLRALDPDVKAVVSSGYSDDAALADYAAYGFSGCLLKPYTCADMAEALRRLFDA